MGFLEEVEDKILIVLKNFEGLSFSFFFFFNEVVCEVEISGKRIMNVEETVTLGSFEGLPASRLHP